MFIYLDSAAQTTKRLDERFTKTHPYIFLAMLTFARIR